MSAADRPRPPARRARAAGSRAFGFASAALVVASMIAWPAIANAADKRWSGLGDGSSFSDPANWNGGVAPTAADDVTLDNTLRSGTYNVNLPAGAVTVTIHRLTIAPSGANVITLTLPSTNTANPGLRAGDGLAGTDDIVLASGAVLRNASGASFGNGIEANSVVEGTVRINNGARYVHATMRAASGIAPLLSTAAGTELGEFEYDVPGTAVFNLSASGRTYGSVTLTRSAGAATYGALGGSPWHVRGNLKLNAGVTLNSTMSGPLQLDGNFSNVGNVVNLPTTQELTIQGTAVQTIAGTAGITLNGGGSLEAGATLAVSTLGFNNNGIFDVRGTLRVDQGGLPAGAGTYVYDPGATLILNYTSAPLFVNGERYWPAQSGPARVTVQGAGVSFLVPRTVGGVLAVSAPILGAGQLTLPGTLEMRAGGSLDAPPLYSGLATLRYAAAATVGPEWGGAGAVGVGVPMNVTVDAGAATVNLPNSNRTVPGDLTVTTGTLQNDPLSGDLLLLGNATVNGTLNTNGHALIMLGTGAQTIAGASAISLDYLRISKSTGSVVLGSGVTLSGTSAPSLEFNGPADVLDLNGRVLTIVGAVGGSSSTGVFRGSPASSLLLSGAGSGGTIRFASGFETLGTFTVNRMGPGAAVTLGTTLTATSLYLTAGNIVTGSNVLTVASGGTVTRTSGFVDGNLRKSVGAGAAKTVSFEIGSGATYASADVAFANVTTGGTLTARTVGGDHPAIGSGSGVDASHSVNRNWSITNSGIVFNQYDLTLHYPAGEIDPGSDLSVFDVVKYDAPNWSLTATEPESTKSTAMGLTSFSDFAVGQLMSYPLTVTTVGNGSVTKNPDAPLYVHGTYVQLTAVPVTGYHLVSWSGDATGTQNPLLILMDRPRSITATFAINTYTLDVTVIGSGTVAKNPDQPTYNHGTQVTLTATPSIGYTFTGWSGGATGNTNPLIVTMTANKAITATFTANQYPLTVNSVGNGTVSKNPDQPTYTHGTVVQLTANPAVGWHLVSWSGDASGSQNPLSVTMNGPKNITATFAINTYTLAVNVSGSGTVAKSPDQPTYTHGTVVQLTATPVAHYHLVGWSGDASGSANPLSVTMDGNKSITATFAADQFVLTTSVVGQGSVVRTPDQPSYDFGTEVELVAVSGPGSEFTGWGGDTTETANPIAVVMTTARSIIATFGPKTPWLWSGLGDGTSWTDGDNWDRQTPPTATSDVLLDNTLVGANYLVTLPSGATTVTVNHLLVTPTTGSTITVVLPLANTANPGLRIGDNLPSSDDLVLGAGAVLRNQSGATIGNGIEVNSIANGTIRINNGGHYVHATLRSASGVVPQLSTAAGTEMGEFEYDVPGTAIFNLSASGRTYGSLTLTRTAGASSYGALGSNPWKVRGTLKINPGVALNSTMSGALQIGGDLTVLGPAVTFPATQAVTFNGASTQTVSGASGVTLNGNGAVAAGSGVVVAGPFSVNDTLFVDGTLRVDPGSSFGGTGAYVYHPTSSTLVFNQSGTFTVGTERPWPSANGPRNVTVQSGILLTSTRSASGLVRAAAQIDHAERLTVSGTLRRDTGGSVVNSPVYSGSPTLLYTAAANVGDEWADGSIVGPGVPKHVTIDAGAGTVTMPAATRLVPGDLTITSGTLALNPSVGDLVLFGNLTANSALNTNGHAVLFVADAPQTISAPGALSIDYFRLNKTAGTVKLLTDVNAVGTAASSVEFNGPADIIDLNGHTMTIAGSIGGSSSTGAFQGSAASTMALTGAGAGGTLRFAPGSEALGTFTVNRTGAGAGVTLASALTATTLNLTAGGVLTGANVLTVASGGTVNRVAGLVDGNLRKTVPTGVARALTFEVGSAGNYAPVAVSFGTVTTSGTVTGATVTGDHPNLAGGASLDPTKTVNRYWTLTSAGTAFDAASATFNFTAADLDPGVDPNTFVVRKYNAPTWSKTTLGTHTATSTQATGLTTLGDFAVGTPVLYPLTVSVVGSGTVAKNPDQPTYEAGTSVTLTATPDPGYHFQQWSGDLTGNTNPATIVMSAARTVTATFEVNGPRFWVGTSAGGDGVSWGVAANWSGGQVPAPAEDAILDNTTVTGNYTVTLPAGAVITQVNKLTITPSAGHTITLTLPATNTGSPGLRVGDSTAATDDIVLNAGAVLRNSSGAASGAGIALLSAANGTLRINNGARYVHNSGRTPAVVAGLSTAAGTEAGEFEYDVPTVATFALDLAGRSYGSLILSRSSGTVSYTATGATPVAVRGDLRINTGVTLSSTMTAALNLSGSLVAGGAALTVPATQPVNFVGTGVQTVSGAAAVTLNGTSTVPAGTTLGVSVVTFNNNSTMSIDGALQINQGAAPAGTGTYDFDPVTGTLIFNNTSGPFTVGNDKYWPTTGGPQNVTVLGAGGIDVIVNRTVSGLFQYSASVLHANRLTASGTVQFNPGGSMGASITYSGTATLVYNTGAAVGLEWASGSVVGAGVPRNVTIQAGTLLMPNSDRNVPGNLTIGTGSGLTLNSSQGNLIVGGNLTTSGTLTSNARIVRFTGTAAQTIAGSSPVTLDNLELNKTGGSVQLLAGLTLTGTGATSLAYTGNTDVLDLNGRTLSMSGGIGGSNPAGAIKGSATSNLVLNGVGAVGTMRFVSGSEQLGTFTLNRTGTAGAVTLGTALGVTTLNLTSGNLTTGSNVVSIASGGTVTRGSGKVVGNLRKSVPTGAGQALAFEVGTGTVYAPVAIVFGNVTATGSLTAASVAGDHPNLGGGSGLDPTKTVNRYWTVTNNGVTFNQYSATFNFVSGDVDAGAIPSQFVVRKYNAPTWSATTTGTRTSTSTQATGLTSFSDFAIGAIQQYTLSLTTQGNGTAAKSPDQPTYDTGTNVTLTATPSPGHTFVGWTGDLVSSANPVVVNMNANKNITANFTFALTVNTSGSGSVAKSPDQPNYAPGTTVTLTPNPITGWHFVSWGGDTSGTTSPLPVVMWKNKTISATFAINTYPLTVTSLGDGSVTKNPNLASYTHGTVVQLTATPSGGQSFVGWAGDATGSTNPLSVTMTSAKNISAIFTVGLTTNIVGGGSIAKSPNQTNYTYGSTVQLTATPAVGYSFAGWSGDTTAATNPLPLPMNRDRNVTATFTPNSYTLTVGTVGSGSVAKNPNQATYTHGTLVQLTATPAVGYGFTGWSGDTTASTNPLPVPMIANKNLTATFTINSYTLNVATVGTGSVSKNPNQATYTHGTLVQLTATPGVGYTFAGWSGDTTATTNPLPVPMIANKNLTATFTLNSYTLNVTTVGNGSVAKNPNQATYAHGTLVQLTATPGTGYSFTGWSGDTTATTNPLNVPMIANKNITATFTINSYTLNVSTVGSGSVAKNPNQATYTHGTIVQLTATPAVGYSFTGWSGDTVATTNPLPLPMIANRNLTATFTINSYTLTLNTVGNGSVAKNPNQATYTHGTLVQITATPGTGYSFAGWSGDTTATTNPLNVPMIANKNITATFTLNAYTLSITTVGSGSVAKNPNQPTYPHGTIVQLTATPAVGYTFTGWSGDTVTTTNPLNVPMTRSKSLTATFTINTYTLTINTVGNGTVSKNPNQATYNHGTVVTLTATPGTGYSFAGWSGDTVTTTNPLSLTMVDNTSLTATFTLNTYTLTLNTVGNGTASKNPNQATYSHGTIVQVTATAGTGYSFTGWSGDTVTTTNPLNVPMTRNKVLTATFTINAYTLTINTVGNGTVSKNPNQPTYPHGTIVQLTATPAVGYTFTGWSGDTVTTTNPLNVPMTKNKSLTATFTINSYTLTLNTVGNGTASKNPNQATYTHGTIVQVTATPGTGYSFTGWSGDTVTTTNPLNVPMTKNKALTATFSINSYTLSVSTVGNGSVTKDPDFASYPFNTVVQLTAVPSTGWSFTGWSGDASGTANPTSVTMTANRSVTATFTVNQFTLTVSSGGGGSVAKDPDQPTYAYGTIVQVTATPDPGFSFVGWSGDAGGNANPISIVVDAAKTVVATFADTTAPTITLIAPDGPGSLVIGSSRQVQWSASDPGGVTGIDVLLSRTGAGGAYDTLATGLANSGSWTWIVTGPQTFDAYFKVVARDAQGNRASARSDTALAIVTSVGVGDGPALALSLGSIAPNPTRGAARVSFTLPQPSRVRMSLVDVQGREVEVLVDDVRPAGRSDVAWNGRIGGATAPAGIYFLRFESEGKRFMRRVVVNH